MPISSGTYTVGTGGNYATLKAAFDDIDAGGLTGDLTFTVISEITETGKAAFVVNGNGYKLTVESNFRHDGNITRRKNQITLNHTSDGIEIVPTGNLKLEIKDLYIFRATVNPAATIAAIKIFTPNLSEIKIHDLILNGNNRTGRGLRVDAGHLNHNIEVWNIFAFNWVTKGIEIPADSGYVENCQTANCGIGFDFTGSGATSTFICRNCVAFGGTTRFAGLANVIGRNNASDSTNNANGNWKVGSGNLVSLSDFSEWISTSTFSGPSFGYPQRGGFLYNAGTITKNKKDMRGRDRPGRVHKLSRRQAIFTGAGYFETADPNFTDDIDVIVYVAPDDWSDENWFVSQWDETSDKRVFRFGISSGKAAAFISEDGINPQGGEIGAVLGYEGARWLRYVYDGDLEVFASTNYNPLTEEGTWTSLGTSVLGAGAVYDSDLGLVVGLEMEGAVLYANIKEFVLFNPNDAASSSSSTWVDKQYGQTWTKVAPVTMSQTSAFASSYDNIHTIGAFQTEGDLRDFVEQGESIEAAGFKYQVQAVNNLALTQEANRQIVFPVNIQHHLLVQEVLTPETNYTLDVVNNLQLTEGMSPVSDKECLEDVIENRDRCNFWWPVVTLEHELVLPSPLFSDTYELDTRVNPRHTKGGNLRVYKAGRVITVLEMTFRITRPLRNKCINFFEPSSSQLIRLLDWEGRLWNGVVTNTPLLFVSVGKHTNSEEFNVTVRFEGERI